MLTEITTLLTYTAVLGLALLICYSLIQLNEMAAVIAVMVLGLGISITRMNVLTHGEVATYDSYGVGAVMAVLVLGLGTCITCMNGLTHGKVGTYDGYGVGSGDPDLGWDMGKVPDRRRLPGGAFLGKRGERCLETYRKAPGRTPRPLAASPGAFPPHPAALAQLLGG